MFRKIIAGLLAVLMLLCGSVAAFAAKTASGGPGTDVPAESLSKENVCDYREYQSATTDGHLAETSIQVKAEDGGTDLYLPGDGVSLKFTVHEAGWYEPHIAHLVRSLLALSMYDCRYYCRNG